MCKLGFAIKNLGFGGFRIQDFVFEKSRKSRLRVLGSAFSESRGTDHPGKKESNVAAQHTTTAPYSLVLFGITNALERFSHAGDEHVDEHNGYQKRSYERTDFQQNVP